MADALVSPAVGGAFWVVSGGLIAGCARALRRDPRDDRVPLMGVLGAFVFTAQMINFSIPGTGSSGHLGGGLLLAVLLGPHAAFLVIASVLTVQAFFFADGGLLALGANLFNLGFFPAFVAYPLVYRPLSRGGHGGARGWAAAVAAAVVGLECGALGVVLQTRASGLSDLATGPFLLLMLPVHLAIGAVEGLATAAVVAFVARVRPETLAAAPAGGPSRAPRPVWIGLLAAAALVGGVASWFASTRPDGLEGSIARLTAGRGPAARDSGVHGRLAAVQRDTAILPDYGFPSADEGQGTVSEARPAPWPAVSAGTSTSGIVGGLITLALAGLAGLAVRVTASRRAKGVG